MPLNSKRRGTPVEKQIQEIQQAPKLNPTHTATCSQTPEFHSTIKNIHTSTEGGGGGAGRSSVNHAVVCIKLFMRSRLLPTPLLKGIQ
jgi:hypothetical protein